MSGVRTYEKRAFIADSYEKDDSKSKDPVPVIVDEDKKLERKIFDSKIFHREKIKIKKKIN